jgi:hypothetical protein
VHPFKVQGATASATNKNFTGGCMSVKMFYRIWRLWVAIFVISATLHFFGVNIQSIRSHIMLKPVSNDYQSLLQDLISHVIQCKEETELFAYYNFYTYPHPLYSKVIPILQDCVINLKSLKDT